METQDNWTICVSCQPHNERAEVKSQNNKQVSALYSSPWRALHIASAQLIPRGLFAPLELLFGPLLFSVNADRVEEEEKMLQWLPNSLGSKETDSR